MHFLWTFRCFILQNLLSLFRLKNLLSIRQKLSVVDDFTKNRPRRWECYSNISENLELKSNLFLAEMPNNRNLRTNNREVQVAKKREQRAHQVSMYSFVQDPPVNWFSPYE